MRVFKQARQCSLWGIVACMALCILKAGAQDEQKVVSTDEAVAPKIVLSADKEEHEFYGTGFTQNGKFLISRHVEEYKTTARVWDLKSGALQQTFWPLYVRNLKAIAIAPDNKTIALGTLDSAKLREFESGVEKATWDFESGLVREAMEFSPDGRILAIAQPGVGDLSSYIRLWSVAKKRVWKTIPVAEDMMDATCVAFSPDGKLIACGYGLAGDVMDTWTGEVKIWRVADGKLLQTLQGHTHVIWRIAFSPDGKKLASAASDKTVRVWDVGTGKALHVLKTESAAQSVAFAADGSIASGDDKTIRMWKSDGTPLNSWQAHDAFINSVAFNSKGDLMVSASDDGTLKLWNVQDGNLRLTLRVLTTRYSKKGSPTTSWISYTPDGYYVGSADCEKYIHWRVGNDLLPAAKFQKQFRRPDLVAKALQPD